MCQLPEGNKNDALRIKLVLISEGRETDPLMYELPGIVFEPQALAARIADRVSKKVAEIKGFASTREDLRLARQNMTGD
jgi:hypothetical protein